MAQIPGTLTAPVFRYRGRFACIFGQFRRVRAQRLGGPVPTKHFSEMDEKLRKQDAAYAVANKRKTGGVMDIVVAFLALISIGVFAAHTLDAMRTG